MRGAGAGWSWRPRVAEQRVNGESGSGHCKPGSSPTVPQYLQLLTELRSAQEEENRQLLAEVQALSRENRELLERSLESRDHLHREQREYL